MQSFFFLPLRTALRYGKSVEGGFDMVSILSLAMLLGDAGLSHGPIPRKVSPPQGFGKPFGEGRSPDVERGGPLPRGIFKA